MKKALCFFLAAFSILFFLISCDAIIHPTTNYKWGEPEKISTIDGITYRYLDTSADDLGNTLVGANSLAKRYIDGIGWYINEYEKIEGRTHTQFISPCIRQNARGDAVVVWDYNQPNPQTSLYGNYYTHGGIWHDYGLVHQSFASGYDLNSNNQSRDLDINASGQGVAVWINSAGSGYYAINGGLLDNGTGAWTTQTISLPLTEILCAKVAFILSTEAIAVWLNDYSNPIFSYSIYSGSSWGAVQTENLGLTSAYNFGFLKSDQNGNCIFIFKDNTAIRAKQFTKSSGTWGPTVEVELFNSYSDGITFDMNKDGRGMLCWRQLNNLTVDPNNIYAKYFDMNTGWGTTVAIDNTIFPCWYPAVAVDKNGNAMALWMQEGSTENCYYASNYTSASGWNSPQKISKQNEYAPGYKCALQADSKGRYTAVWVRYNNTTTNSDVWACRFE